MTKDELKHYMAEAIDAMEPVDVDALFPANQQPDLYTIVAELTGLRGEVKKLSQSNLQLNNQVHSSVENQKKEWAHLSDLLAGKETDHVRQISDEDIKKLLDKLIEQDDQIQRMEGHLKELPPLVIWKINNFKQQFAAWKQGFDMTYQQWNGFMQQSGIYKTGLEGEPFDPRYHEAIATKQDTNQLENTILETQISGILFQQVLIRRAKVVVNKTSQLNKV